MPRERGTSERGADSASRTAGEWFEPLLAHAEDIFVSLTPKLRIEYVSPAVEQMLGYRREEMEGRSAKEFFQMEQEPHMLDDCGGEGPDGARPGSDRGVAVIRALHRDGRCVWCEATYRLVRNEDGRVVRVVGVCRDITERKRTEEELRRSKASFMLAQQIARLGHYEWDFASGETVWSDELYALFGYRPADFADANEAFDRMLHPDDRGRILQIVMEASSRPPEDDRILSFEYRMFDKDGGTRIVQCNGKLLLDKSGLPARLFGTLRDVTNERQTEELLRKSEKLKMAGQLAAGIAHEIRNPLTSLKGFSKLLRAATGEQAERYYAIMDKEFVRIESILSELLLLAKPQAATYREWDVRRIVQEVVELLDSQAILNDVVIQAEVTPSDCIVRCENNQLKQVFMNLVKNAIEAMPGGGPLRVQVTRDGGDVTVRVADRGAGIPPDKLHKIGEPFFTTKERGTGLGLMVSYQIIEEHKGTIAFESEVGQGTTVCVRLPAVLPDNES